MAGRDATGRGRDNGTCSGWVGRQRVPGPRWAHVFRVAGCLAAWGFLSTMPLGAQDGSRPAYTLFGSLGTGIVNSEKGVSVGGGGGVRNGRFMGRIFVDAHLVAGGHRSYAWHFGSDGPQCRHEGSGVIVDGSLCSIAHALFGVGVEGGLSLPLRRGHVEVVAGYRAGVGSTGYGSVGYGFNPAAQTWRLTLRGVAGGNLLRLEAVVAVPIGADGG